MPSITIYSNAVTSGEFADASDAQGSPASGDSAPYATTAIGVGGTATLDGAFAATAIPGTITAIAAVITARSLVGASNVEVSFSSPVATFSLAVGLTGTFAVATDSGLFADTLKTAIVAGTFTLDALFSASLADTVDAKGLGIIVTYTDDDIGNPGSTDLGTKRAVRMTHF
jgi:hypothetical protein